MSSPTDPERPEVVEPEVVEPEVVLADQATEPGFTDLVDAEVVEPAAFPSETAPSVVPEPEIDPVTADLAAKLSLGDAAPEAPSAAGFEVDAAPQAPAPVAPSDLSGVAPSAPPVSQPGGSWLDLPPMPDLPGLSAYPEPASPGFAAGQTPPPPPQQYSQPAFGGYDQLAGQSYGHGTPQPQPQPQPYPPQSAGPSPYPPSATYAPTAGQQGYAGQQAPYAPYGTTAGSGYGMQPYQATGADTTMASMAHWLSILIGFIGPLVIMLTRGQQDPFVRANAVESLNFQITLTIGYIISSILTVVVVGVLGLIALPILGLIFTILGAIAASRGEVYRYPFRIPFVK